jgi:DNA-binding response OmpR family regulator
MINQAQPKTILVCDDDEPLLELVTELLTDEGYNVECVSDATSIFALVRRLHPDLILLDLWMPGISGEEITLKLKKDPATSSIPIIIVSAHKDTVKIVLKIGADDFILKPFDINELSAMVAKHC